MILFPAIDIQDSRVVRLVQGKFDQSTSYGQDPLQTARHWIEQGARWLHVIDLDGARTKQPVHADLIIQLARSVEVPVQVGGGLRTPEHIERYLNAGVDRVIIGTKAVSDFKSFTHLVAAFPGRVVVSLDCFDDQIALEGWIKTSESRFQDFLPALKDLPLSAIVYTDIRRDGMLTGPNLPRLTEMLELTEIPVIASGGVHTVDDIKALSTLEPKGLEGVITGKALYEGTLTLKEAIAAC